MHAVIHTPETRIEVVADHSFVLHICLTARDNADEDKRTSVSANITQIADAIGLHAVLGAYLRAQGVQL